MHMNHAHDTSLSKHQCLLFRSISLRSYFEFTQYFKSGAHELCEKEEQILTDKAMDEWKCLSDELVNLEANSDFRLDTKLKSLLNLNAMEGMTAESRISEADTMHDRIAWSIIRDLLAARLSPA